MSLNRTVENVYLRQDALQLTRKHLWPLIGLALLFNIVTNTTTRALTSLCNDIMYNEIDALTRAMNYYTNATTHTSLDPVVMALRNLLLSPKYLFCNLLYAVVAGLVFSGLTLGRCREYLDAARGGVVSPKAVFSLMRYSFKGWRLFLLCVFKVALWALPGLITFGLACALIAGTESTAGLVLLWLGFILIFALTIPAYLRYSLAAYVLCDEPENGVIASLRLSKALMKGRKWQYFKLLMPTILKALGMVFLLTLLLEVFIIFLGAANTTITLAVETLLLSTGSIYFVLQLQMLQAVFFEKVRWPDPAQKPAAPVSYWLQDHSDAAKSPEQPVGSPDIPETDTKENKHEDEPIC